MPKDAKNKFSRNINNYCFSANFSKKPRKLKEIKFVIIHYGMQSEIGSVNRLKNPKAKVSCHYLINREGNLIKMVKWIHSLAW